MPWHPLPGYSPTPCPHTRAASILSQAGTSKGLCRRQLWDDALTVTDASPCSGSLFLPSLSTLSPAVPASLPGCWHTPAQPALGAGLVIGKGNCKAPKLISWQWGSIQQPLQGPVKVWRELAAFCLVAWGGRARLLRSERALPRLEQGGSWWSLLLLLGCGGEQCWSREQPWHSAQGARVTASDAAPWPQECYQAPLLCTAVAAISSSIFYSLTKASKYSPD